MMVTHRKAAIDEIERAWHGDLEKLLNRIYTHELVEECAVLKTCNRVEIYVVSPRGEKVLFEFAKTARVSSRIIDFHDHNESLQHLLRLTFYDVRQKGKIQHLWAGFSRTLCDSYSIWQRSG